MGVLHLVSRSPHEALALSQCLDRAGEGDALLLLESGVYAVLKETVLAARLQASMKNLAVYALKADLAARGIAEEEMIDGVAPVDYAGFVELSLLHSPIQSWF